MSYSAPLALLAELKYRLTIGDTADDTVLAEMLLAVSGAIEAYAGRKLRREHCVRERFAGGGPLIRVSHAPIAAIHWVRESWGCNFEDENAYDELVEGEDYVLEASVAGDLPGEGGWIRRIGGDWLGSRDAPATIEVCYTGGYKTPGEAALENETLIFDGTTNTALVDAFSVGANYIGTELDGYQPRFMDAPVCKAGTLYTYPVSRIVRTCIVFQPGNVLIPTWEVVQATLALSMHRSDGGGVPSVDGFILPMNPRTHLHRPEELYAAISALNDGQILTERTSIAAAGTPDTVTITLHVDMYHKCATNMKLLNRMLRMGFLAFALRASDESLGTTLAAGFDTPRHETVGQRPSLTLVHRDTLFDPYVMPDDLKHACLLQVAQDWQIRRNPGYRQEVQRGVSISSGISYMRDPADLLPEVRMIARRYARYV